MLVDAALSRVWLLDFGVASRLAFEATTALLPEALEGTLAYISPEQTGRTARTLDARTDLYALGVLLYEALAGRRPFLETDALALVHAHLAKPPLPLDSLVPEVPAMVTRVVSRLLAKDPEQRYQTAKGLAHDLHACLLQWRAHGRVEPFVLGTRDFSPRLRLPDVLLGREAEVRLVREAFGRASSGGAELLLVGGASGIGKTALVRAVYKDIAAAGRGILLGGKHDQLARSTPYAALAQAFGGLMQQLATAPRSVVEAWAQRLLERVGKNLRVIADLVPELEWITGPLEAVQDLPGEQSFHRLKLAFAEFVLVVTELGAPMVLFLDDMQWVDPASVELLKLMLTDPRRSRQLLIFAYRDNEVEAGHPLWSLVNQATQQGMSMARLQVGPLAPAVVAEWMGLTLEMPTESIKPLAELLSRKTAGNPFFLGQLLLSLYQQKQVWRDLETGQWVWDLKALEHAQVTGNVVSLMRQKLDDLASETVEVLGLAACAGHKFTFAELQRLLGQDARAVSRALWPALHAGLVVPVDARYREAHAVADAAPVLLAPDARYQFLHDRVQQACYERIPERERARAHLDIGRRLRTYYQANGGTAQELLELVRHLNLVTGLLESREERVALAQLNLRAAAEAKKSGIYQLMTDMLEHATALLGEARWATDFELAAKVAVERIAAAYFTKDFADVEARSVELLQQPLCSLEYWRTQQLRLRSKASVGDYVGSAALGREIFSGFLASFPQDAEGHARVGMQAKALAALLVPRSVQGWDGFSIDTSGGREAEDMALSLWWLGLLFTGQVMEAMAVIVTRVQWILEKQVVGRASPVLFGYLAASLALSLQEVRVALHVGTAGMKLAALLESPYRAAVENTTALYTFAERPARESLPLFDEVVQHATAVGAPLEMGMGLANPVLFIHVFAGDPLPFILEESEKRIRAVERIQEYLARTLLQIAQKFASVLAERVLWIENEGPFVCGSQEILASGAIIHSLTALSHEAQIQVHLGRFREVLRVVPEPRVFDMGLTAATCTVALWSGLASARLLAETTDASERAKLLEHIEFGLGRLRSLAQGCPENFAHKLALLVAEQARLFGRTVDAMAKYDEAIDAARAQGFLHIEGLAAQLCADFHLEAGRLRIARVYLVLALDAYTRWGALRIVRYLRDKHARLLREDVPAASASAASNTPSMTTTTTFDGTGGLDVDTAVRAAQALGRELDPERVVSRLMHLVLENAGAERGILLLGSPDALRPKARLNAASKVVDTELFEFDASNDVVVTAVSFVARTAVPLQVGDARADVRFAADPRVAQAGVCALLVVPLQLQGKLSGVLYLEHDTPNSFPPARVALSTVLAAQAATALQNARLYADLQRASFELKQANTGLEVTVAARTAELQKALSDLWAEMDLAKKIQTALLPTESRIPGYELAAVMRPAEQVGGDYYDVFHQGGQDFVLIGDVSGHGVPAGLCMMMIQTALRTAAVTLDRSSQTLTPSRLLALVDEAVRKNLQQLGHNHYMTISALCITGGTVRYAGLHQDLLVYRAARQTIDRIETQGVWLGVVENDISEVLQDSELRLELGDVLLLYTDGYTEAKVAGRQMETEGLAQILAELCRKEVPIEALIAGLLDSLGQAEVHDDVTLVALRRLGAEETSA